MANTPNSLADIYSEYDRWNLRLDRARRRREVADRTVERCYKHLGPTVIVEQIAELLAPHFPAHQLEVLGPFGLACETVIHANSETGECVGSLAFRSADNRISLIDRRRDTGRFAPNTIGALNGLNHPSAGVPGRIEDLVQALRDSIDPPGDLARNPESAVLDAIDKLVNGQLTQERSGYDRNIGQQRCVLCDGDWHGEVVRADDVRAGEWPRVAGCPGANATAEERAAWLAHCG